MTRTGETSRDANGGEARSASTGVYDALSSVYDVIAADEWPPTMRGIELLGDIRGLTGLEIGYGTGRAAAELAARVGSTGRISGVDASRGMYRRARARMARLGYSRRTDLSLGDTRDLPYPERTFDFAFAGFTVELFRDRDISIVLGELKRVLRPSGRLAVVSLAARSRPGTLARIYAEAHRLFPRVIDCRPLDVCAVLESAGFAIRTRLKLSTAGLPTDAVLARTHHKEKQDDP